MRLPLAVLAVLVPGSALAFPPSPPPSQKDLSGIHRLSGPGTVSDEKGKPVALPAGTRVIVLPGPRLPGKVEVVAWKGGKAVDGEVDEGLVDPPAAATVSDAAEARMFLEEASLTGALASALDKGLAPDYTAFSRRLAAKLLCLAGKPAEVEAQWPSFKKGVAKELAFDLADKPGELARFKKIIFGVLDPVVGDRRMSDETMLIPLNKAWFTAHPRLADYYKRNYLGGGFDIRIEGGNSGEGVTRRPGKPDESFDGYQKTLLATRDFARGLKDPAVEATPEYRWLDGLSEASFEGIRRFIFVHEFTWGKIGSGRLWADYIAVDQNFPGLPANDLLSVLIHEINVNSDNPAFLPADTHLDPSSSIVAWKKIADEGLAPLKDPAMKRDFFGLNPYLGAIYLGWYADKLSAKIPACR